MSNCMLGKQEIWFSHHRVDFVSEVVLVFLPRLPMEVPTRPLKINPMMTGIIFPITLLWTSELTLKKTSTKKNGSRKIYIKCPCYLLSKKLHLKRQALKNCIEKNIYQMLMLSLGHKNTSATCSWSQHISREILSLDVWLKRNNEAEAWVQAFMLIYVCI